MCGGRSSILHYGPLIETNYLYAPTPNGQKPECVAKQTQYPIPFERTPGHDADALVLAHHKLLELRLTGQQVVLLLQNRFNSIR